MRRRKRKKISHMKSTLFIMTIIALSSIGVGYGTWSEGLNIDLSLSTGEFDGGVDSVSNDGALSVGTFNGGKTLKISGKVISGDSENITFTVKNTGTVPGILRNTGSVLYPGDTETLSISISPNYTNKSTLHSLQSTMPVQSLNGEEETFDIGQILNDLFPTQTYSFGESYYFEQEL